MELEITSEQKNPLVNRTELKAVVQSDASPNKMEVAKAIAEKYSVPVENLRVLTIYGRYGRNEFEIVANIYESKEERDEVELISKKESEAEAKATEVKPEEVKAEEAAPVVEELKPEAAPVVEELKPEALVEEAAPEEAAQ